MPDSADWLPEASALVKSRTLFEPRVGLVLGSGLGEIGNRLPIRIPYDDIPGMPGTAVPGHAGNLRLGELGGVQVACLQGRAHLYEGHSPSQVVLGVRLLAALGCRAVLLTNAAGGIAAAMKPGDRMLVIDHLNLTGQNPLVGSLPGRLGSPFVDMGGRAVSRNGVPYGPYDARFGELVHEAAEGLELTLHEGVYAGLLGPSYETPAEVRMLRALGADAVGMSTVHEAIALRQLGVRVAAISTITNPAAGIASVPLDHKEVEAVSRRTAAPFIELVQRWVELAGKELAT